MTEDSIQKAVMTWARWQPLAFIGIKGKLSDFIHHSPNGGYRSGREGRNFSSWGQRQAFPICLFLFPKRVITAYLLNSNAQKAKRQTEKSNGQAKQTRTKK